MPAPDVPAAPNPSETPDPTPPSETPTIDPAPSSSPILLTVHDDYFPGAPPPLPPRPHLNPNPSLLASRPTTSADAPLQAKPTTAISLPEGVYAQQQDGL